MIARTSLVVLVAVALVGTGRAWSQTPPPDAPAPDSSAAAPVPPPAPPAPPMEVIAPPMAPSAPPMAPSAPPPTVAPASYPPTASFKSDIGNGSTLKVGLLLQPQFQSLGSTALDGNSYNLYIRRTRLLVAGTLFGSFEYFFDTDYPNLFLATNEGPTATAAATTTKATPGMNIQDAFATWKAYGDMIKFDVGYMLPPMAHNAVQGAGTLYSWDYFAFSFLSTANALLGSTASPVGRDAGVQFRGLLLDGHIDLRLGLFQGLRATEEPAAAMGMATTVGSNNFFRATGRLQINLLDSEPGFFYAGTYLGKKKILSIGITGDTQKSYHYYGGDVFADLPLGPGIFTAQVDVVHMTGGTFIALAKQSALMSEVGFNFGGLNLSPIFRFEHLWGGTSSGGTTSSDQTHVGGGLAFWPYGHNSNIKAFYLRNTQTGTPHGDNQVNVQWQVYFL
jgi:hypothetical protein